MKQKPNQYLSQSEIAVEAHRIWDEHGKPDGQDLAFWLEAEKRVIERSKPVSGSGPRGDRSSRVTTRQERLVYDGE